MLTRHTLNTLTRALIATIILCALTQAAPEGVSPAADVGLAPASTSEISTDLANNLSNVYAITDTMYNAQTYTGTEFDGAGELAHTTPPPMTREEMELAETAAVAAELASTTADEMKVKTTVEEEDKFVRRRAEQSRQGAIARAIANTVEAGEGEPIDEKDFITITTYRSNFLNTIGVTQAPITSVAPSAATTTFTATTTNSSPEILNELVRAASAANEILAAALNVATIAITNMTSSEPTTTSYASMQGAITNDKPIATANSVGAAIADEPTLTVLSDGDALQEQSVKWQTSKGAIARIPIEITTPAITTTKAEESFAAANTEMLETTTQASENETTSKEYVWNETKSDIFLTKLLADEYLTATVTQINQDKQEIPTAIAISEQKIEMPKVLERIQSQMGVETAAFEKTENPLDYAQTSDDSAHEEADNEAAESLQIITKESTTEAATLASGANEVESETFNFYYASSTGARQHTTTPSPYKFETNAIEHKEIEIAKNIVWDTTTPANLAATTQGAENVKETVEIEIAKVQELKLGSNYENKQESTATVTTTAGYERIATNVITVAALDVPITTTEPLETLIAVESEERAPTQIVIATEEEKERTVVLAPFTSTLPESMSAMETVTEVVQKEVATDKAPTEISTTPNATAQETTLVGEITPETQTKLALSSQPNLSANISAKELIESKVEPEISTAESEKLDSGAAAYDQLEEATSTDSQSMTTEAPQTIETMEISTDFPTVINDILLDAQAEPIDTRIEASLTSSDKIRLYTEKKAYAVTELQPEPVITAKSIELASVDSTTPFSNTATTNRVQIVETGEPVTDAALDFTSTVIKVPLAPFTTTTTNPLIAQEVSPAIFTTTKSDIAAAADIGSTASISSDRPTQKSYSILPTTLNSDSETAKIATVNELTTEHTNKGDSIISVTTSDRVVETTTTTTEAPITVTELNSIATTTPKAETKTETVESKQLLSISSSYEQQPQQEENISEHDSTVDTVYSEVEAAKTATTTVIPVEAEKETENEITTEADVRGQFLYMRVLNEQQRAFQPSVSTKTEEATKDPTTAAATTMTELSTPTETINMNEPDGTTTTSTSESATIKTTTGEPDTTAATETTTSTTTTTTTTPEPETTTTTTTNTPEQETTTTTTMSPMSLIIAEHEARSLDKTPPRVSRVVNDDGVEVLSGYSVVHRMHAAALAALEEYKDTRRISQKTVI